MFFRICFLQVILAVTGVASGAFNQRIGKGFQMPGGFPDF